MGGQAFGGAVWSPGPRWTVGCQPVLVLNAPPHVPAELVWLFPHPQGLPSSLRSQRPR